MAAPMAHKTTSNSNLKKQKSVEHEQTVHTRFCEPQLRLSRRITWWWPSIRPRAIANTPPDTHRPHSGRSVAPAFWALACKIKTSFFDPNKKVQKRTDVLSNTGFEPVPPPWSTDTRSTAQIECCARKHSWSPRLNTSPPRLYKANIF
jgi:hypothetical protein